MVNQPDSCPSISVDSPARQPDSAHLSDMLDSLSDGFMSIDRSWRFIYLNLTAEQYLQQKRENLVGQVIWQCFPELAESGYGRVYLETLATGQPGRHTDYYAPLNTWFEARSFAHDDGITVLFRDVTYNHQHEAQLQFEANHDYLTGLPNRRKCMEVLSRVVSEAACADLTRGAFLAVLLIDLDHFKEVNDAFGHSVGDGLLRDVANRLLGILEPSIFVARVGGDKFILLYSETTESAAEELAHAILGEFATPFNAAGKSISLSASIGIALLRDESTLSETLLSHADTAMYAAKASGRHRVRLFDDALDRGMRDRLSLRMDLPGAFAAKQFELHFQPQIALYDDSPIGAEALLRWRHPERGLLGPAAFLEVLLDSPYEETLVGWLLNAVCEHIGAWRRLGMRDQRISLNLSPRQLLGVGLLEKILEIANAHNVPLALIGVEVTEESLVSDIEKATSVLAALSRAGISTSLDDFGSGYSSLGYLVRLPIETLKIDRSFVQALVISEKASAVVRGIVGLAKSLGMKTVAEGVENERQLAELRDAGCDVIQGYLISRPLEADAFAQYMLRL